MLCLQWMRIFFSLCCGATLHLPCCSDFDRSCTICNLPDRISSYWLTLSKLARKSTNTTKSNYAFIKPMDCNPDLVLERAKSLWAMGPSHHYQVQPSPPLPLLLVLQHEQTRDSPTAPADRCHEGHRTNPLFTAFLRPAFW